MTLNTAAQTVSTRNDSIRNKYFDPIENLERWTGGLFYLSMVLSVAAFYGDEIAGWIQWPFLVCVITLFGLDQCNRLYLTPRALDARNKDFLSKAYNTPLADDETVGYYNNDQKSALRKIAAQVFENCLFSMKISWIMFKKEALINSLYITLWLFAVLNRDVSLSWIVVAAQVIFSEQVLSRCIRLFWMYRRVESIFEEMKRLYVARAQGRQFDVLAMDSFTRYESTKATAGITLSSKVFDKMNPSLSLEWDKLRKVHGI